MEYGTCRDLLFFIVPQHGAIEESTGWDAQRTPEAPDAARAIDEYFRSITVHNQLELDVVQAVLKALTEITEESRELKLIGCKEREKSKPSKKTGHIPLEISPLDYKFWARKSIWNPDEAALISIGFVPTNDVVTTIQNLDDRSFLTCPLLKEFRERGELIVEANRSGQLGADGDRRDLVRG